MVAWPLAQKDGDGAAFFNAPSRPEAVDYRTQRYALVVYAVASSYFQLTAAGVIGRRLHECSRAPTLEVDDMRHNDGIHQTEQEKAATSAEAATNTPFARNETRDFTLVSERQMRHHPGAGRAQLGRSVRPARRRVGCGGPLRSGHLEYG